MKMNALKLTQQSIAYFFSHKQPGLMAILGFCAALVFIFGIENHWYLGLGSDYWYEIPHIFFRLLWQFWVVGLLFVDMGRKKASFFKVGFDSFLQTCSVLWLVAWLVLLQWASIPLIRQPYCYSESVDLSFYILLKIIIAAQLLLNFFMIPMIVDGERSFSKIVVGAVHLLIKNIINIAAFFCFFCVIWLLIFGVNGLIVDFIRRIAEAALGLNWSAELFRVVWVYSTGYFIFAFLCVAQGLFYLDGKRTGKKI
jgi:hypothetical protein